MKYIWICVKVGVHPAFESPILTGVAMAMGRGLHVTSAWTAFGAADAVVCVRNDGPAIAAVQRWFAETAVDDGHELPVGACTFYNENNKEWPGDNRERGEST